MSMAGVQHGGWREASGIDALFSANGAVAGWSLLTVAFLLPLWAPIIPVAIGVALAALLFHHRADLRFRRPSWHSFEAWAMLLYTMHVAGMLWSANTGFGLFDLEIKAPLLLLPLVICFLPQRARIGRSALFFALAMGGAVSVLAKMFMSGFHIISHTGLSPAQEIFSSAFSAPFHPSYLALYLCAAIAAWYLTGIHRALPRWAGLVVFALFCTGVVLCASKAGWLVLLALMPLMIGLRWREVQIRNTLIFLMTASVALGVLLVALSPYARDRVKEFMSALEETDHDAGAGTSSKVRWITWAAAWDLFEQQPMLGTGTGDIKDELLHYYSDHHATEALERRLNAHQQFLQTAACLGILGLVALSAMLFLPLIAAVRARDALGWMIPAMVIANLMVESMLEVQAGVCFIAFVGVAVSWSAPPRDLRHPAVV